jgi:hypothetical protein
MARYEREGNDDPSAAQEWDSRAAGINDRLAWRCADCGRESPDWEPVCAGCNGFDTLGWRGVVEIVPVPGTITVEAGEGPPPAPLDDGPDAAPRRSDSQG